MTTGMSQRANDAVRDARTLGNRIVRDARATSTDQAIAMAQLRATLATMEVLIECEAHLFKLTTGRSA